MKNNYKYDAILYDLDGTLIDSVPVILKSFELAYIEVFGSCNRTKEDFKSYIGKPLMSTFSMHDKETSQKLFDTYLDINCEMLRNDMVDLFPGVKETLQKISSLGIKQALVTSKKKDSAMITVNLKNLDLIFDEYVFLEDTKKHKPDAEPIIKACQKLGIKDCSRVLYVGDALADALCAANAGADFALVSWSDMSKDEIQKSVNAIMIDSMEQLSCIIERVDL